MNYAVLSATTEQTGLSFPGGYVYGLVIGLLILCYLVYTLIKPEKF